MKPIAKASYGLVSPPSSPTSPEMRQIARKWELFVTGADVDLGDISPIIRDAWIRSKQAGVDPTLSQAPWEEMSHEIELLREDWLSCAEKGVSFLSKFFAEPHQLVTLVDRRGRILAIRGGHQAVARAERISAVPGANWNEKTTGCNALATSVYTGLLIQVSWQENYLLAVQDWTSVATALHHPTTGEILGAVGISGHDAVTHPRVAELCLEAGTMIEGAIREQETTARLAILERFGQLAARYPADGLLALDKHGRILSLNPAIEKMLSLPRSRLIGQPLQTIPMLQHLGTAASIQQLLAYEPVPGVSVFPVPLGYATAAILLLSQPTRAAVTTRQLEQSWTTTYTFTDLVGQSPLFQRCVVRAHKASQYNWPVLLLGESGTGKELFAQSIHSASPRRHGPFIPLDCASVSDELIGMELFGYEEGAFTGAAKGGKPGKLRLAHGGTLFLDDVDNLPAKVQVSLLRVLETGQVVPIGGNKPRAIDIRVVAASNRELEQLVREGKFRLDLYHRLNVVAIQLPPLRERREDIPLLARQILSQQAPQVSITEEALDTLRQYPWPGNVRELKNVLLEAALSTQNQCITTMDLPVIITSAGTAASGVSRSRRQVLDNTEAELIVRALQQTGSVTQAASRLGLHQATLYRRMKKYGIALPSERKQHLA
ncbi:MAG TPA: sigma 54-interacting transcriptional regulator [Candidatus Binatia bacterium]|nr:sigma 54-interacting transcriptional regulator [Candidatus Binatia bacterium]